MPEERREQRQLRVDVVLFAIPAKQRAQHERMADVMYAGSAPERFPVKAGGAAEPIELMPDGPLVQSCAGVGDRKLGAFGRAQSSSRTRA
jgi:hypothetical protein